MNKIKNIKVSPNRKYKLYKTIAGITAAIITINSLAGCSINHNNHNNNNNNNNYDYDYDNNSYYSETYSQETNQNNGNQGQTNNMSDIDTIEEYSEFYNIDLENIFSKHVKLSDYDIEIIKNEISSIKVNYPYSELYYSANNLEKYINKPKYKSSNLNLFNNNLITGETIFSIVINNNLKENFPSVGKISEQDIKKICSKIAETLNYIVQKNNNIDFNLLSEKIQNLKIRNFTGFSNGSYDSKTGIMWLDVNKLNSSNETLKKVISHETVHLVQANSLGEIQNSNISVRIGPSYSFNDSKVNSLDWTWFAEGTAETIMMEETCSTDALTYSNLIKIIETIKLATIMNPQTEISSFEHLSLNSNLDDLFSYFNCRTREEKIEIINMMFGYEFISGISGSKSAKEFYDCYENIYGDMNFSTEDLFKKQIKGSIAQTLSKQFYQNLAISIKNKDTSIKDIFEMISIYESQMNKLTWYAAPDYAQDLKEFIVNYIDMQDNFFQNLSQKTNLSLEEIQLAYEIYNLAYKNDFSDIKLLEGEKKNFIANVKKNREKDKTVTIRYFYQKEKVR